MLGSFQTLYPKGSLLTELVQIYNGKYIVKASLQIETVTRATAMAAAETLELAEDSARQRVIAFFGNDAVLKNDSSTITQQSLPPQPLETKPAKSSIIVEPQIQSNGANNTIDTTAPLKSQTISNLDPTNTQNSILNETNVPEMELPQVEEVEEVEEIVAPSKTKTKAEAKSKATSQNSQQFTEATALPEEPMPDIPDLKGVSKATTVNEKKEISSDTYDDFSSEEPLFETVNTLPNNVTPFTGRNYNPPEEIQLPPVDIVAEPPISKSSTSTSSTSTSKRKKKTDTTDQSDDIAKIGLEMQRLGWTTEQGRDYLIKQYNKRSRHLLTPDELRDFRQYLESQPTPDDPLAFDPIAGF
jgi:hypothetical protein